MWSSWAFPLTVPSMSSASTASKRPLRKIYPDIKILQEYGAPSSSKEDGLKLMPDILTAHKQIDAVYSMDDELSIGLYQAIKEAKRTDVKAITGGGGAQDYFNTIAQSDIALSSQLYSPIMIKECVAVAKDLLDGKTVEENDHQNGLTLLTNPTLPRYLDANSPY